MIVIQDSVVMMIKMMIITINKITITISKNIKIIIIINKMKKINVAFLETLVQIKEDTKVKDVIENNNHSKSSHITKKKSHLILY